MKNWRIGFLILFGLIASGAARAFDELDKRVAVGATFEGDLALGNIDPQGECKRLCSASAESIPPQLQQR